MQPQERPSPSAAKGAHWRNWLLPGWDCEDPAAGAGHEACCREGLPHQLHQLKEGREKGGRDEQGGGWSKVTLRTRQDRDGLEKGVANPGVPGKS